MVSTPKITFNFHRSNLPFAVLIRFFTRTRQFNHVSLETREGTYEAKMSIFKGLTKAKSSYKGTYDFASWARKKEEVFKIEVDVTDKQYERIKKYLDTNVGYRYKKVLGITVRLPKIGYDYKSILGFINNTNYQDPKAFNCGEFSFFIVSSFIMRGVININKLIPKYIPLHFTVL